MADPFQPSFREQAKRYASFTILLAIVGAIGLFLYSALTSGEQPIEYQTMTVEGFGMGASYTGSEPIVRVRDEEGTVYSVQAMADIGQSCEIGDRIAIIRQGISLKVGPEACSVAVADQ